MSTFGATLASIDEHNHREQIKETWGHLAPVKNRTYNGRVVYAVGCFGDDELNPTPIFAEFRGLDSSPWFYEALCEFIGDLDGNEVGYVYEWTGTLRNYEFDGVRRTLLNSYESKKA